MSPALLAAALAAGVAAPAPGRVTSAEAMGAAARAALAETGARGLAIAVIERGQVKSVQAFGVRNAVGEPLTTDSVMYAASLTKAVFGWLVVQLADEGRFSLDHPIARMLPRPLPQYGNLEAYGHWGDLADDPRWQFITPRMVLNHTTGFANFAELEPDGRLRIHHDPGRRYGYSGEGVMLLQFALEQGLKIDVAAELETRLFAPLKIRRTALKWHDGMGSDIADGFTADGTAVPHDQRGRVRAAGSMDTTIDELARIVSHIVRGAGMSARARANFTHGTLPITTARQFPSLQPDAPPEQRPAASAALGVIAFNGPQGPAWMKGGHNDSTANMLVCLERGWRCVLILSNDVRAEAAYPALVNAALGETGAPWRWEYGGD